MKCPNCKRELLCGCNPCIERSALKLDNTKALLIWKKNTDLQFCNHCNYTLHCDEWLEIELKHNEVQK